jgi:uncharacterized protein (TIGR03086 family)
VEHIQNLHGRTIRVSVDVVSHVTPSDLGRATPCGGWTVADLLAHMVAHHRGFAAAARGSVTTAQEWESPPVSPRLLTDYPHAAEEVIAAFAADGVLERKLVIPVLSRTHQYLGRVAIGFHLIDYVVHSWDVARTIGLRATFDRDVLAEATLLAFEVPDGDHRLKPDSLFAPAVTVPPEATELDRIVAVLGRSPAWPN